MPRMYDHGHVEFTDGTEIEFGFVMPDLPPHDGTNEGSRNKILWSSAAAQALAWANTHAREHDLPPFKEQDIKRLRLAG